MTHSHPPRRCACGGVHAVGDSCETAIASGVEKALLTGLFPNPATRRNLLSVFGASLLLDAVSALLPMDAMKAMAAADPVKPEKTSLIVGMIPIVCATPLIVAQHDGLFSKHGLGQVAFVRSGAPALIRDKLRDGGFDMAQQVMTMPLATTLGIGTPADTTVVAAVQNQHGGSLTMALKHKDRRDPKTWKGLRFGVPFEMSVHALLLRYLLAEHGIDPDADVSFRVIAPGGFVAALSAGQIDGFFAAEPHGQRAVYEGVGYLHTLSGDLWPGHPCCAFTARPAWIKQFPNTYIAAVRAVVEAGRIASERRSSSDLAQLVARPEYLGQPKIVVEQVLSGTYADGLGNVRSVPDRIAFDTFPYPSMAIWLLTQLKRWGFVRGDVRYGDIAQQVMYSVDAQKRFEEVGLPMPAPGRVETIMGRAFDPARADAYLAEFKIRRA